MKTIKNLIVNNKLKSIILFIIFTIFILVLISFIFSYNVNAKEIAAENIIDGNSYLETSNITSTSSDTLSNTLSDENTEVTEKTTSSDTSTSTSSETLSDDFEEVNLTKYVSTSSKNLNVREGASTSYNILTSLSRGTKVTVTLEGSNWSYITSPTKGWVYNSYLSLNKVTTTSTSTSSNTSSSTSSSNSSNKSSTSSSSNSKKNTSTNATSSSTSSSNTTSNSSGITASTYISNGSLKCYPSYGECFARIKISSIGVNLPVYFGSSDSILEKGVGFNTGSYLPSEGGSIIMMAHNYTKFFGNFSKLSKGDTVEITTSYGTYTYKIYQFKIVDETDVDQLPIQSSEEILMLYTCYPFR